MQGKKLTPEDEARILRAARDLPIREIVRQLGYSRPTVQKILRKFSKRA